MTAVYVSVDVKPFERTLHEVALLAKSSQGSLDFFNRMLCGDFESWGFEYEQHFAERTSELTIRVKAGTRLLKFLAALRAGQSDFVHSPIPNNTSPL